MRTLFVLLLSWAVVHYVYPTYPPEHPLLVLVAFAVLLVIALSEDIPEAVAWLGWQRDQWRHRSWWGGTRTEKAIGIIAAIPVVVLAVWALWGTGG